MVWQPETSPLTRASARFLVVAAAVASLGAGGCGPAKKHSIEIFPQHFDLRPREMIRYTPMVRGPDGTLQFAESFEIESSEPRVLEMAGAKGLARARAEGAADLVVRSGGIERRFSIEVRGNAMASIRTLHHTEVDRISGENLLFVGHANRDGFDHTAVAKPGIDRWVDAFEGQGHQIVFWVSEEYPNWYGKAREPDLAIVSEGQEHEVLVDADRVVYTGGDFMACTVRNVQMSLHKLMLASRRDRVHFVFPPEAIWTADIWWSGNKRPYPAPMVLLSDLWARHASDLERYESLAVPFLDRVFREFPVLDYPAKAPTPHLQDLARDWTVSVTLGSGLRRTYRRASSGKTVLMDFRAPATAAVL